MTNSIASAKCPSILTSGKYGMSQRCNNIDDSKEYIFVKLTDSAFRAIEEYQRNVQSRRLQKGQCAKIQFLGNSGVIQFPPTTVEGAAAATDGRKFGFAIDDVEGSLECIHQSGEELDVLGSLNYRMRIHANDDVYDTTRTKMAIAEETEKSKCIREIKPNQTDIGRKVKRNVSAAAILAYSNGGSSTVSPLLNGHSNGNGSNNSMNSSNNGSSSYLSNNISSSSSNSNSRNKLAASTLNQHSPPLGGAVGNGNVSRLLTNSTALRSIPNPSLLCGNGTVVGGSNVYSSNRYGSSLNVSSNLSSLSSNISNCIGGYSPPGSNGIINNSHMTKTKKTNLGNSNSCRSNGSKVNSVINGKLLDVSRRKIRERLIHLLALKPFKKPELYARLQNEGLATRERQLISTILKDISTLARDNTYNLRRSMWNDVDENWPFFSEQEIQQLKRRKPQNLTPPMSSDAGSSTSGQSPTSSVHTGSPPPLVNGAVNGGGGIKRTTSLESELYDASLTVGMQSKKQRISHYKKDGNGSSSLTNNGNLGTALRIGMVSGGGRGNNRSLSAAASYSPQMHNTGNTNSNDENSVNSDLTFNVLKNMDDFIQHTAVVGGDTTFAGRSKTTVASSKIPPSINVSSSSKTSSTISTAKEKRNSGGSSSSSSGYSSNKEYSSSSAPNTVVRRKNSPTPYAKNFVPETKTPNPNNNSNSRSNKQQQQQGHRKQQQSSLSVIPNVINDVNLTTSVPTFSSAVLNNSTSYHSRHHSHSPGIENGRESSLKKHSISPTPSQQKHFSKHHNSSSCKNIVTVAANVQQHHNHHQMQLQQYQLQNDQLNSTVGARTPPETATQHSSQSIQQQEHSSPTQQIAAAASTFSLTNHSTSSGDVPRYDFSSYTPITSIEQRRKYKTEFESDYDEYRKLLAQVESVGHRFRELADRLSRVQQGCIDYYNIKDQIVNEYNRIRKEEAINRDKQRFDYLHEKLAHIKQLVMDYDKKLTSGLAAPPTTNSYQQEPSNYQQQQTVANTSVHLSPMLQSSGESNHSPPLMLMQLSNGSSGVDVDAAAINSSSSYAEKSSKNHQKYYLQQQQQQQLKLQQEHYQQYHEPETIQMSNNDDVVKAMQYRHFNNVDDVNYSKSQQHITTSASSTIHSAKRKHERKLEQELQLLTPPRQKNHNHINTNTTNGSDSDSESSSSSSSNDDNSDDDNSDASDNDDENSDHSSNDDDNVNQ